MPALSNDALHEAVRARFKSYEDLCKAQEDKLRTLNWYPFGFHTNVPGREIVFSKEKNEAGDPYFESPVDSIVKTMKHSGFVDRIHHARVVRQRDVALSNVAELTLQITESARVYDRVAEELSATKIDMHELEAKVAELQAKLAVSERNSSILRNALTGIRSIGATSGTNTNAWNEAFDVIDGVL